ncbi:MAG: hypothetical protein ABIR76_11990 [Polaromonas sp.]
MSETTIQEGIPKLPVTLVLAIAAVSCLAGGTLVFFDSVFILMRRRRIVQIHS